MFNVIHGDDCFFAIIKTPYFYHLRRYFTTDNVGCQYPILLYFVSFNNMLFNKKT